MKGKHKWLILALVLLAAAGTSAALLQNRGGSKAAPATTHALERLLARVPSEVFQWDYLSYGDFEGEERQWLVSTRFSEISNVFSVKGKVRESTGISPGDVGQSMGIGQPFHNLNWLQGQFVPKQLQEALGKQGYTALPGQSEGLALWCLEGDFNAGLKSNMEKRDPSFLFGGEFGQRFPLAFDAQIIVSSRSESALRGAAAGRGKSLGEEPRMQSLLKALTPHPIRQLILISPDQAFMAKPDQALGLIALAQMEDQGQIQVLLGLEYADFAAAKAEADRLTKSLPRAKVRGRRALPLSEILKQHNGKRMELRTIKGEDGRGLVVIPFRFSKPSDPSSMKALDPTSVFIQMMANRDMEWLIE